MDEQLTERQMEVASRVKGQADVLSNAVESGHSRGTCHGLALQLVSEGQVLLKMLDGVHAHRGGRLRGRPLCR